MGVTSGEGTVPELADPLLPPLIDLTAPPIHHVQRLNTRRNNALHLAPPGPAPMERGGPRRSAVALSGGRSRSDQRLSSEASRGVMQATLGV